MSRLAKPRSYAHIELPCARSSPWRSLGAAALACLIAAAAANDDDAALVEIQKSTDGVLHIHAHARVGVDRSIVWKTLTDYNAFPQYVSGLRSSRVLSRVGDTSTVEQQWRIPVLWFSIPLDLTVQSVEHPTDAIDVHLVQGNLKHLDGGYRLAPAPDGRVDLRWDGTIEGVPYVPDWAFTPILRRMARAQFDGMMAEMARRAAGTTAPPSAAHTRSQDHPTN